MAFPANYNFDYYAGDTNQFVIRPKNIDGTPFSLTGYSAAFTIATARGTGATQYAATATVDSVNNIVTCTISSTLGSTIPAGEAYVYDVEISNASNIVHTILTGTISVTEQVTGA